MRPLRHHRIWLSLGWLLVILVSIFSLTPAPAIAVAGGDKLVHFVVYGFLMTWFGGIYARLRHLRIAVYLALLGIGLEALQAFTSYRHLDVLDATANAAGVLSAWLLVKTRMNSAFEWVENRLSGGPA